MSESSAGDAYLDMGSTECIPARKRGQDDLYQEAAVMFGAAVERFSRGYEADPDRRRDLLQDIHLALWRSFEQFSGRCSLRTWVYRVAHSVATSHVIRQRRANSALVGLDEIENMPDKRASENAASEREVLQRLLALIHRLKPLDRQVILSYLEGMDAVAIGEIAGISACNVSTKIHRIKSILARRFQEGVRNEQ